MRFVDACMLVVLVALGMLALEAKADDPHGQPRCFEFLVARQYVVVVNHCVDPPALHKLRIRDLP